MRLGTRLWSLWRLRPWVVASAGLALFLAVWSIAKISVLPPKLELRSYDVASASTHIIVDTPDSTVLDLRQNTDSLQALTQRSVLLGNVIANGAVHEAIAERAHIPAALLVIEPPLTPAQPTPEPGAYNNSIKSLTRSTDQYRISIGVNATVPMLDVYAQGPSASTAALLANSVPIALRQYLARLAHVQGTPPADQIRLLQLGAAQGRVIDAGLRWQIAVLVFLLTFVLSCASVIFVSRIKQGWRSAALADQQAVA